MSTNPAGVLLPQAATLWTAHYRLVEDQVAHPYVIELDPDSIEQVIGWTLGREYDLTVTLPLTTTRQLTWDDDRAFGPSREDVVAQIETYCARHNADMTSPAPALVTAS